MYDKSKKTWSQRLKIHKNEKSQATTETNTTIAANTITAATTTTTPQSSREATLNVAHNVNRSLMPQYQIAATQIMHLPNLSDYHHHQHQQHHNGGGGGVGGGYDYMPNHLGRSMKYAEPWLYGTVRGIPTRPPLYHPAYGPAYAAHPHAAAIFAAPNNELPTGTTAMAVVLCSCPEYLSGTKGRTLKKPSLCKKCKGTRLPLANIGGTVRLTSNIPSSKLRPVGAASTVRVVSSTKKQRPTILDPQKDPYDLMRRTRLLSPEPGQSNKSAVALGGGGSSSSSKDNSRHRGRSASPVRGRSRTRHHYKALAANSKPVESSTKALESLDDTWLTESEDLANSTASTSSRKSILRCNVNPYDLISINQQNSLSSSNTKSSETLGLEIIKKVRKQKLQFSQNEFMPPNDDFNVQDAALTEDEPPFKHKSTKVKGESSKPDSKILKEDLGGLPTTPPLNKKPNYANVQAIAGQRISLGEEQQSPKSLLQQSADGTATYESFAMEIEKQKSKELDKSERSEKSLKPRPDSLQVNSTEPKRPPRANKSQTESETKDSSYKEEPEEEELLLTVTVTPTYNIKSILKRPTSKTSENGEQSQIDSPDITLTSQVSSTKTREGSTSSSKSGTPTNSRRHQTSLNSPTANSQFYIPLPQARKKVQFLVEDQQQQYLDEEDEEEEEDDDDSIFNLSSSSPSPSSLAGDLKNNYEYFNKKRNQRKLIQLSEDLEISHNSEDSALEIITYDEKFIQAMLLEKLQLDSEMVTKRYNDQQELENKNQLVEILPANKTDYEDVFPSNNQSKLQIFQHEENYEKPNDDKQTMSMTSSSTLSTPTAAATTATSLLSVSSNLATTNSVTPSSPSTSPSSSSSPQPMTTHHVTDMSSKNDDIAVNDGSPSREKIFFSDLKECVNDDDDVRNDDYDTVNNDDSKNVATDDADIVSSKSFANIGVSQHFNTDHHHNDNNTNDDNVNVSSSSSSKAQQNGATKSTTSDYDDDAKIKQQQQHKMQQQQHQQQQQQLKTSKKDKKDIQTLAATDRNSSSSRETQSRNPIRRSQSERQPTTTYHNNNNSSNNGSSNNGSNNNGFNYKNRKNATSNGGGPTDGSSSNLNENIISNTRNRLKDIENIPNIKNGNFTANIDGGKEGGGGSVGVSGGASVKANKTLVNFQDTMALRNRYNRNDTRDLFAMSLIGRPREPPPPPPTSPSTLSSSSSSSSSSPSPLSCSKPTTPLSNSLLKAKDLKDTTKSITLATDAIESCQQHQQQIVVKGLENQQQEQHELQLTIGHELKPQLHTNTDKIFSKEINGATLNQDTKVVVQQMVVGTKSITTTQLTNGKITTTTDILSTRDNIKANKELITMTSPRNNQQQQQQQKTVVRVAPFNKNSSEVHRLKISHTDHHMDEQMAPNTPNTPNSVCSNNSLFNSSHYSVTDLSTLDSSHDYGQKKTSIMINGDDCYSTMNLSCNDSSMPLYQSSVVVTDGSSHCQQEMEGLKVTNSNYNTVTINVSSPRSSEDELILQHNQLNNLLKRQSKSSLHSGSIRAIIPIRGTIDINLQRSASSTSSTSTSSLTSTSSSTSSASAANQTSRGKTLIRLDYDKEKLYASENRISSTLINEKLTEEVNDNVAADGDNSEWLPHETELLKILRNPVEAVKRNLVPHICKLRETDAQKDGKRSKKMNENYSDILENSLTNSNRSPSTNKSMESSSFIGKLLEDPMLQQVAEGLETETVAELIENSLKRLQDSRSAVDMSGTKDNEDMNRLIDISLKKLKEERNSGKDTSSSSLPANGNLLSVPLTKEEERLSNRGSISSANSFASAHNYELFDFEAAIDESDCYQSCSSDVNSLMEDDPPSAETKSKFYQMLVDATLQEIELSTNIEDSAQEEHQYESIRHTIDPIYEEISDVPPPLPLTAPPLNDPELEKKSARSIFEGASKYDILSYLVDAKERGLVKEEPFDYPLNFSNPIIIEEESSDTLSDLGKLSKLKRIDTISSRSSIMSDSSDDNQSSMSSLSPSSGNNFMLLRSKQATSDIERNDSGVGSETSKSSRSKYLSNSNANSFSLSPSLNISQQQPRSSPLHLCEDCDGTVETQISENGHVFAPLVCRKCGKKRVERKEIITEVVETEEKYGRDLQIILEEFCHPMLVAGLLTQEQLSAIFLNTEELLENNQTLAERMRDALDIALEQGDDDLLTVNIGKIFLDSTQMLHAFESYCVRQAGASLLLANLEKDKELLRIFLKVSQMENAVLRRMNLNSFLMVPVQRVTKYPLLLARLYKVTPAHLEGRDQLKQAQEKIELHLNHINQEAKDVPTKLWRRISSSSPNRRASCEIDMINIKLRKMAIDVLEWNHDEVRFVMEGKLLYTQPTDSNWKKARTIKLTTVNALLVTNGKPSTNYKAEKVMSDKLNFPKHTGIREASLLVVKEKCGRYTLIREPLYLDRCVVCSEVDWDEYFEIQEISSKDTFIFKAEDNVRTKQWYTQLQYHAQGMGAWRKRRNALANIMINGMLTRS